MDFSQFCCLISEPDKIQNPLAILKKHYLNNITFHEIDEQVYLKQSNSFSHIFKKNNWEMKKLGIANNDPR